jgi:hypothetical protein
MRLVTLALIAASACLAATPDLSGSWKFNSAKSDFGAFPAPSSLSQKVTHAEPKLTVAVKMTSDMGDLDLTSSYTTDGKETTNPGFGGGETKSVAKWEGDILLVDTKGSFGDQPFTMKDRWTLSEDGKVLTIQRHFASGMGEVDQKIVLDKQ